MALTLEDIIAAAAQLAETERRRLVELTADEKAPRRSITELRGPGNQIWQGRTPRSTSTKSVTRGQADLPCHWEA